MATPCIVMYQIGAEVALALWDSNVRPNVSHVVSLSPEHPEKRSIPI